MFFPKGNKTESRNPNVPTQATSARVTSTTRRTTHDEAIYYISGHMSKDMIQCLHWQRALSHHVASHNNSSYSSYSTLGYAILVNILRIANYYSRLLSATLVIPLSATLFSATLATLLLASVSQLLYSQARCFQLL